MKVQRTVVRDHVVLLQQAGWTITGISRASGVSVDTLHKVVALSRPTVQAATAELILSVSASGSDSVPICGPSRRVRALAALGWPDRVIAGHAGVGRATVAEIRVGTRCPRVTRDVATGVAKAFTVLWDKQGPSVHSRNLAARKGWALPLEWDDIDDPTAEPIRSRRTDAGVKGRTADRQEAVAEWVGSVRQQEQTVQQFADELGYTERTILRDLKRLRGAA